MKILILALTALMLPSLSVWAAEMTCRRSPAVTGACATVKGSLGLTRGIGVTLNGEDGTRTIIKAPPGSNADIAPRVMENWLYWQSRTGNMNTRITGTFEVCPLPAQVNAAGIRDFGCINNGTRINVDKDSPSTTPAE
ncbi:MAG TPA: hypothetical protein VHC40_13590 [Rhizomicrobium sp.]|nr:hypothetical protein [Rhizomicrobium sp.]